MNWVDGMGWLWVWDSVGRAVDIPTQRYSAYPHPIPMSSPPIHDRKRSTRQPHSHHLAQTSTHHTYLPCLHPTELHSRANSTRTNSIRPATISTALRTLSHPGHTLPPPNHTHSHTSTKPIYPTIHTPHIIVPSKPSYLYMPTPPQRLASVLARRTCHYGGFAVPWLLNTNVKHRI